MRSLLLLAWLLPGPVREGHVDRVEGAYAVVLWSPGDVRDVPLCLFDGPVAEGDVVLLAARADLHGGWVPDGDRLVHPADAGIDLPLPPGAVPGRRYRIRLSAGPGPEGSSSSDRGPLAGSDPYHPTDRSIP